ncbi:MAG: DUF6458 family protein [Dehalococcoidia bacterium]
MGMGVSIFLIAIGAILAFAINYTASGIDINAVGVILMVVGGIGLALSMLFWSSFAPFPMGGTRTTTTTHSHVDDPRL